MACGSPSLAVIPGVYILLNLVLGEAVAFLDFALELITLSIDSSKIIVGEVAPLLFDLTLDLLPVTFDSIPIHVDAPFVLMPKPLQS
jgi:hypothetical protein